MSALRHAVLFAGTSAVLVLIWALGKRQTVFWPGWAMAIWLPFLTLQAWSALHPDGYRRPA